jgi:1-aminocyclopropane-1-carboxylate deaminase/D-cysteine desulfhydrase-like pyridoxal-dependent ACC family enzyme
MMNPGTTTLPAEFPRYELLRDPTLLQRLERTEAAFKHRGRLYVKRDDLMPIAMGGNKLRSLEFWLGAAFQEHADVLLVAGTPMSNLCRLTAAAASMAGLECIVFHNEADDAAARRASFLNRIFGASVRFIGLVDEAQRTQAVEHAASELQRQGRRPYIVGNAAVGALGYVRGAEELLGQSRQLDLGLRHVLLPGSMGTTEAGMIFGNALLGYPFEIHLVSVEYPEPELKACVRQAYEAVAKLFGNGAPDFDDKRVHYHMDFLGGGYACPTPQGEEAILTLARTEGIVLEHIYSAKTFACFLDFARRHVFPAAEPVCVIHTGGVPALFSQFEVFRGVRFENAGSVG